MRLPASLAVLLCGLALAGCAQPEAGPQTTDVVGEPGPDVDPGNLPPATVLQATPSSGRGPLEVVFSLSARDPEGDALAWTLDLGDGSGLREGDRLPVAIEHVYAAGVYEAVFTVDDGKESTTARIDITAQASAGATSSTATRRAGGGGGGGGGSAPATSTSSTTSGEPTAPGPGASATSTGSGTPTATSSATSTTSASGGPSPTSSTSTTPTPTSSSSPTPDPDPTPTPSSSPSPSPSPTPSPTPSPSPSSSSSPTPDPAPEEPAENGTTPP